MQALKQQSAEEQVPRMSESRPHGHEAEDPMKFRWAGVKVRLLVMGDSGVGKSSLVLRFTDDRFEKMRRTPTIGMLQQALDCTKTIYDASLTDSRASRMKPCAGLLHAGFDLTSRNNRTTDSKDTCFEFCDLSGEKRWRSLANGQLRSADGFILGTCACACAAMRATS